jgi:superfamily II DNA or RNA helicase
MAKRLSAERLADVLENGTNADVRGVVYELPRTSLRSDQPLFGHQLQALEAFEHNGGASGIVHLPTGAGKTRVAIDVIARRLRDNPRQERVLWATYPTVLIRQAMTRIAELAALFPSGTKMSWAEPNMRNPERLAETHITLLMRDDLAGLLEDAGDGRIAAEALTEALRGRMPEGCRRVTLIYDECHQLGAEGLQRAWNKFSRKRAPRELARFQTIGFSATPLPTSPDRHELLRATIFPVDGRKTAKPDWGMLVHASISNAELVEKEILCPVNLAMQETGVFQIPDRILDAAGAGSLASPGRKPTGKDLYEFSMRFNNRVLSDQRVVEFLAERLAANLHTLGKTLVFVPTIDAANRLAQALKNDSRVGAGRVTLVHTKLDEFTGEQHEEGDADATRTEAQIAAFRRRGSQPCIMVNVGMLTTGFDDPKIRTVVLARLTFSTNLFWQMIGRGTRGVQVDGTPDCYVIDPVGLTARFSVLEGYRPHIDDVPGAMSADGDGDDASGHPPELPKVNVPPTVKRPELSPKLRADLREALERFYRDGRIDPDGLDDVAPVATVSADGTITTTFVPKREAPAAVPSGPFMAGMTITALEETLRKKDAAIDLAWLRSAKYMPASNDPDEIEIFNSRIALIREHGLTTEAQFKKKQLDIYRRG